MSYNSYRTSSAPRGRGFTSRGSFRGRGGGGDGSNSWNSTPRGGRGGYSGPSRGRFNFYKGHGSSNFDTRRSYGSGGFSGSSERFSDRAEDSYRRSYHGDISDYSSRDHSHHRSPESPRKRMRTEHSYVQASSGRRSHEGGYGGGTDYNSRYSYEDKGYGEDRSRGYRDERRSAGGFRDRSREEYPHRKADHLDSGMPPPSGPPRHVSSPRGSFRGRVSSRGSRGMSRLTLARRTDAILARKRSIMDSYSIKSRILASSAKADYIRRLKIQKLRRMRAIAARKDSDKEGSGKGAEEVSEGEEDGELGELEDWDSELKKESEEAATGEDGADKPKPIKKKKKTVNEEEREEGEEVDEEDADGEEVEEEETAGQKGEKQEKMESPQKSDKKNDVNDTSKQDLDTRAERDKIKHTTYYGKPFIKLACPVCLMSCITFKEYAFHLYSAKHVGAMCKQSLRLKQTLSRMRMIQRQKQRTLEEAEEAQGTLASSYRFCPTCKLSYRHVKTRHQLSDYHKTIERFLNPYCRVCRIGFKTPMQYESHMCSLNHIKREARFKENMRLGEHSRDDGSGMEDEDRELNLDNFMTLDSVGTVDDDEEEGSEGEEKNKDKKEGEKKQTEANLGSGYIKKVEVLYCEMCRTYLPREDDYERALSIHCRSRPHLSRYVRYRDERSLRREAERRHKRKLGKDFDSEKSSEEKKKKEASEKTVDSTTDKGAALDEDVEMKVEEEEGEVDTSQEMTEEGADEEQAARDGAEGGEDMDQELEAGMDDKLWADVDKDLGDLLREVEPGNKSSDEDEDSRAEGGRYDRFRYSEKGSTAPHAEGDAPDTTKTAGDGEGESEVTEDAPVKDAKATEGKDEADAQSKKQSPGGDTASSTPAAGATN